MSDNYVRILGARGSVPVSGKNFAQFGGATFSLLVKLSGNYLVVDAGSGLFQLPEEILKEKELDLLLTHLHLDHLIGLPLCPFLFRQGNLMKVHIPLCTEHHAEQNIRLLFSPPFWPVTLEELPAEILFHKINEKSIINNLCVEIVQGIHPGGVVIYKISNSEKSIVVATDCTLTDSLVNQLKVFADHCDLLLIDGQYNEQEWKEKSNYGHSEWYSAVLLGKECMAKKIRLIHHDPAHTDSMLEDAEERLKIIYSSCAFARENELITL